MHHVASASFRQARQFHPVLANIADLPCLPLHFNAVEARLPHERQTAVWQHLFPSRLGALTEERHS